MKNAAAMNRCQIHTVPEICKPLSVASRVWQFRNRLRRIFKRRYHFLCNYLFRGEAVAEDGVARAGVGGAVKLQAGDVVQVRSREEISATLDHWNQLRHCAFMEEMWLYCGTQQKVLKRVQRFLDERDYLMKKCNGIVLLEGVFCEGTKDFGLCDRTCHFFWREEWLEKIEE
ncbi:hypothetical protein LPW11_01660 [Geomonas sp. RF6]|uniref:hypothetical protein n=1 Tax=Geomonas sp. RF6 TaxID=2897342 RepID=UPI001E451165|nr:hypothetical protein [Geomonas sp. RF6]UFS70902.1 hypothetical protein LPW11_01660 [Geomonas sp. RF6]